MRVGTCTWYVHTSLYALVRMYQQLATREKRENVSARYLLEGDSEVVGDLSSERDNGAGGVLELVNVEHALKRELLKVEPVLV
jgi:hypothetical protein